MQIYIPFKFISRFYINFEEERFFLIFSFLFNWHSGPLFQAASLCTKYNSIRMGKHKSCLNFSF